MSEYSQEMEILKRIELAERKICLTMLRDLFYFVSKSCGNKFVIDTLAEYKQLYEAKDRFEAPPSGHKED